ncbi:MAG: CXXX repeat peptide maturase [Bacteroidales bacterium]|nr:CXXX repeat peptide maturase [Bacteroidales bacterium]
MIQYLVILLDKTSIAYCHSDNPSTERELMPLDVLRKAIRLGMRENMMIQYVYPDYDLPKEYEEVIESIDHVKIGHDIEVLTTVPTSAKGKSLVLRLRYAEMTKARYEIAALLPDVNRLNITITDIEDFDDSKNEEYTATLELWSKVLLQAYKEGKQPQFNLLTDRIKLKEMHNCGAGVSNITLAPNGKFYLCQAFYFAELRGENNHLNHQFKNCNYAVGDIDNGIDIPNQQLLRLDHAPLCHICDAYHCHRCIYLNQKLTWDNNTPSHQQCLMAHLERNAARNLMLKMKAEGMAIDNDIKAIDYLDPFEVKEEY